MASQNPSTCSRLWEHHRKILMVGFIQQMVATLVHHDSGDLPILVQRNPVPVFKVHTTLEGCESQGGVNMRGTMRVLSVQAPLLQPTSTNTKAGILSAGSATVRRPVLEV
mmetsp:Transcript_14221/g.27294  ORF Transcript_14221/g.27294 Transcript_14221/m.27294 type:complete len:110 (+) Transcript_14221:236-565(+)